jgi:para-aminobenzoate synthetase/4-amino-4-deoxychorismate lyase
VTISNYPVSSLDPLLYHKTSARHLYDHEFARAVERGFDEILFVNERGELTEGSRTNIFLESSGELLTPALGCGLLDGCLRRELLDGGLCREARLTPADVARAGRLFVGNSLRGLLKAELVP